MSAATQIEAEISYDFKRSFHHHFQQRRNDPVCHYTTAPFARAVWTEDRHQRRLCTSLWNFQGWLYQLQRHQSEWLVWTSKICQRHHQRQHIQQRSIPVSEWRVSVGHSDCRPGDEIYFNNGSHNNLKVHRWTGVSILTRPQACSTKGGWLSPAALFCPFQSRTLHEVC